MNITYNIYFIGLSVLSLYVSSLNEKSTKFAYLVTASYFKTSFVL